MITKEAFNEKDVLAREAGFKNFMNQTTIRILISKMPSTEPELLEVLMKQERDQRR